MRIGVIGGGAWGTALAQVAARGGAEPVLLWADVDLDEALDKRLGERNDVFADRRPDLY